MWSAVLFQLTLLFLCSASGNLPPDRVLVTLPDGGVLLGIEAITETGRSRPFHAFLGVPYAQPPLDELRFAAPEPITFWYAGGALHDCTKERPTCSHYRLKPQRGAGCSALDGVRRLKQRIKQRLADKRRRKKDKKQRRRGGSITSTSTTTLAPPPLIPHVHVMDEQHDHSQHEHKHHGHSQHQAEPLISTEPPTGDVQHWVNGTGWVRVITRVHIRDQVIVDEPTTIRPTTRKPSRPAKLKATRTCRPSEHLPDDDVEDISEPTRPPLCCEQYSNRHLNGTNVTRCRARTKRGAPVTPPSLPSGEDACGKHHGNEDCLYVNVYAPASRGGRRTSPLPVLVYIPGAAGDTHVSAPPSLGLHGADFLVERGIVVVAVTGYRRQALGWLCPGGEARSSGAPGNQAARDVLAALRWTVTNAAAFGGDPRRVTAWGDGEGGALVHLLQTHARPVPFTAVVLSGGGSALAPWAVAHQPEKQAKKLAFKHLALFGDERKRVDKLRRSPAHKLQKKAAVIEAARSLLGPGAWAAGIAWGACVEHETNGGVGTPVKKPALIATYTHEMLQVRRGDPGCREDVPMLVLHTDRRLYKLPSKKFKKKFALRALLAPRRLVPEGMRVRHDQRKHVASKIRHHYLLHRHTAKLHEAYLNYLVDSLYLRPSLKAAALHVGGRVWVGRLTGPLHGAPVRTAELLPAGRASHELLQYIIHSPRRYAPILTGPAVRTRDQLLETLATFTATHEPPRHWPRGYPNVTTTTAATCVDFGASETIHPTHPDQQHLTFWDHLYQTYGYRPHNTY